MKTTTSFAFLRTLALCSAGHGLDAAKNQMTINQRRPEGFTKEK
jgi:hypothetical protein